MQKKEKLFFNFFVIFGITIILFGLFRAKFFTPVSAFLESIFTPVEREVTSLSFFLHRDDTGSQIKKLEAKNKELLQKLAGMERLQKDLQALRDQFQTSFPNSQSLLPANIVGAPSFIPGFNQPEILIIDKGRKDSIYKGEAVVVKGNLVGKVVEVSEDLSKVSLIWNTDSLITAKISRTNVLGVIKGKGGGEMLLDNVLLSDDIKVSDMLESRGDLNNSGQGIPAGLIIGQIVSIDKKPSALFQTAKVKSLLDLQKASLVFVITKNE